jgi:type I restriction enzyme R subunit
MYAANILARRHNYPVYIIVDESELVKQFGNELEKIEEISETVIRSDKGKESGSEQLKKVVNSGESGVILSILHLFNELNDEVELEETPVVLADEAHRFLGDILGSQMKSTLEPFHYYGYTGTPIEETYEMFSDEDELYLHRYSMADGVDEDAVLPVNMVSKKDKIQWIVNEDQMDEDFDEQFKHLPEDQKRRIIYDVMSSQKIAGIDSRMNLVVDDVVKHFTTELRSGGIDYKGMVVTKGKENAAEYGRRLRKELGENSVDVIYSADNSDSEKVQDFHKSDEEMRAVIDSFKEDTNPKILIVCEMLRTGFDAPILKTIYLDRRFSGGHTLLQTIARTNRPLTVEHEETNEKSEKMYGEIIDYQGITEEFDSLVEYDNTEIEKFTSEDKEKFKQGFKEKLSSLNYYFNRKFVGENKHNLDEWTSDLSGTEMQKDYMREFRQLRNLYQNIKPDPFIQTYDEEYKWYDRIYDAVRSHHIEIDEEVEDGMIDIVKSNVSAQKKEEYRTKERVVDGIKDDISPLTITKKKETLEEILRLNQKFDPRYEKLSKRVEDIIEKWNQDIKSDEEAFRDLENIREKSDKIKQDINNSDLSESEHMVKSVLIEKTESDDGLNELSKDLVETYNEQKPKIHRWWKDRNKLDLVRREIDEYLYDNGWMDFAMDSELTSEILKKLISIDRKG